VSGTALPLVLGSLWLKYTCVLSKPTIQSTFSAGNDLYTVSGSAADITSNAAVPQFGANTNVAGTTPHLTAGGGGFQGWIIPPGEWQGTVSFPNFDIATLGEVLTVFAAQLRFQYSIDDGVTFSALNQTNFYSGGGSTAVWGGIVLVSGAAVTWPTAAHTDFCVGFRTQIPDDGNTYFLTYSFNELIGSFTAPNFTGVAIASFTRNLTTSSESKELILRGSTTQQLLRRLKALELKIDPRLCEVESDTEDDAPPSVLKGAAAAAASPAASAPPPTPPESKSSRWFNLAPKVLDARL